MLTKKLLAVQKSLPPVPKSGTRRSKTGSAMYDFVTHDDVVNAILPALSREGVLVTSELEKWEIAPRGDGFSVTVQERIRFRLAEGEGGEEEVSFLSVGVALGEATAVGVARSYAKKYGLLNYFLLEQGAEADPENEPGEEEPAVALPKAKSETKKTESPGETDENGIPEAYWVAILSKFHDKGFVNDKQIDRLYDVAKASGWTERKVDELIKKKLGVDLRSIPFGGPYNGLMKIFTDYKPK